MDDSFIATLKLISGEEILAKVSLEAENNTEFFLVDDPIVIAESTQIDHEKGVIISGLIPKKWMLYSSDGLTIINKSHVISISELDRFGAEFYTKALIAARISSPIKKKVESSDNIGYVGKVDETRSKLERIYKLSRDVPKQDSKES